MPKFGKTSKERLSTCHADLQRLFNEVIKHTDISIICGHRNKEDQDKAYNEGNSKVKWPNSRHNSEPSDAVDVIPYPLHDWNKEQFHRLATIIFKKAQDLGIKVEWGGHFQSFFDGPHWQLKRN